MTLKCLIQKLLVRDNESWYILHIHRQMCLLRNWSSQYIIILLSQVSYYFFKTWINNFYVLFSQWKLEIVSNFYQFLTQMIKIVQKLLFHWNKLNKIIVETFCYSEGSKYLLVLFYTFYINKLKSVKYNVIFGKYKLLCITLTHSYLILKILDGKKHLLYNQFLSQYKSQYISL